MNVLNIAFYLNYDASGRITGGGAMERAYVEREIAQGARTLETQSAFAATLDQLLETTERLYINLTGDKPVVCDRPTFARAFSPPSVRVNTESVLAGLPACAIRFLGPETGEHAHPGGDLAVGFVSPGTYTISADPFPCLPIERTLTVTP